jgi:CDP-glucose 4,6-dehydratase
MGGYDPYSSSKGCAELVVSAYRNSFFNISQFNLTHNKLLASARAGNVVGGGDWSEDRLFPDLMRAIVSGCPLAIRSPRSIRPWQHVLDPINGYLVLGEKLLLEKKEFADAWNFGPKESESYTVEEIIKISSKYWDKVSFKIDDSYQEFHEASVLTLNIDKAQSQLGWNPQWDIETLIQNTVRWYRDFYEANAISTYAQIKEFYGI